MANLSLRNVVKTYPGKPPVTAVHDFSLEIEDKEFIILVGPSGCGKSTTLRMIAGLEEITEGELYIGGRLVNDEAPKDRDIAMVFQNYALYPHMSVFKNMAFGLKLRKVPKDIIKEKVHGAAKVLNIETLLNRRPKQLSGGERQRVALGRAMVRDPVVFLLDEPLSNLDAKLRSSMRSEITKLHKRLGTTFIYVTHDQTEAMTMGDRIVVMNKGYIQQVDTPQNLYERPCNLFVAGFIGTPQMNFLDAVLEENPDGSFSCVFEGTRFPVLADRIRKDIDIASFVGKKVVLGIRPEDLHDEPELMEKPDFAVIETDVDQTELMGSETYLYLACGQQKKNVIARVSAYSRSRAGDKVKIVADCRKLHIFNADSEEVLTGG